MRRHDTSLSLVPPAARPASANALLAQCGRCYARSDMTNDFGDREVLSALGLIEQQLGKEDPVLVAPRGKNDPDRAPRRVHLRADHAPIARQGIDALDQSTSAWSRFCQIPLVTRVPHPSTLGKITARCGPATIAALNTACWPRPTRRR
jgi:hypothetical protein